MRFSAFLTFFSLSAAVSGAEVLVEAGHSIRHLANSSDPGIGLAWTASDFDDTTWQEGEYGIGYESGTGAEDLIRTAVPRGTFSVYTRAVFTVADVSSVDSLFLGADYDDGCIAWLNGVEVFRSPEMPAGKPAWDTDARLRESSNAPTPDYSPLEDISAVARPALREGTNVLAIGVWNSGAPSSSDLVLVPRLSANEGNAVTRGPYLQVGGPTSLVVRWRTRFPAESQVSYGDTPGSLTRVVDEGALTKEHVVQLTGLSADTVYYYSVGTSAEVLAGGEASHYFRTRDHFTISQTIEHDCNSDGAADECEIASGSSRDVNLNGMPDKCEPSFRRADANADSGVDLSDGIYILYYLFAGGPVPPCLDAADTDDSGELDLQDGLGVFTFLYQGGQVPPPGSFQCGPDSAPEDRLGCVAQVEVCD